MKPVLVLTILLLSVLRLPEAPSQDRTPLEPQLVVVARAGQVELVRDLIASGTDVNARGANGVTPLIAAAGRPASGPSSGTGGGRGGRGIRPAPPQAEVVRLLLEAGAEVDLPADDGTTALMAAAVSGQADVARDLLEAGANPNAGFDAGVTSLMMAATEGHWDIVQELMEAGARVNRDPPPDATGQRIAAIRRTLTPIPSSSEQPIHVGNLPSALTLVRRVDPVYPAEARSQRVQGVVVLQATIGTDGTVGNIRVISGPELLRQASIEAVRQWRYRPYLFDGQAVPVTTTVALNFSLMSSRPNR